MLQTISYDLENRCNYFATVQALLVNKFLIDLLYVNPDSSYTEIQGDNDGSFSSFFDNFLYNTSYFEQMGRQYLYLFIVVGGYIMSGIDDIATVLMLWTRITTHFDLFNIGIIIGHILRFLLSTYFNGFFGY